LGVGDGDELEWYLADSGEVVVKKREGVERGGRSGG